MAAAMIDERHAISVKAIGTLARLSDDLNNASILRRRDDSFS